jgi:hypothetical protein
MTECINPTEVREGDLLAYAEGQASAEVQDHVRRCTYCAERAVLYERLDWHLRTGLYRTSCPPSDVLARWQLHLLPTDEELQVAAHVRACPHCAGELRELAAMDDDLLSVLLERLQGVSRWLEATLVATAPRLVGLRGVAAPQRRYQVGDLDIFVGSQMRPEGRRLMGRLRASSAEVETQVAAVKVWLVQEGQVLDSQSTDDRGHFVFSDVSTGRYDLGFAWQGEAVLIRDVAV